MHPLDPPLASPNSPHGAVCALSAASNSPFSSSRTWARQPGALRARQAGVAVVLSDFLDPAGYESGLTALVGRGFQVDLVQILAPDELSPATFGDLRLVDSE